MIGRVGLGLLAGCWIPRANAKLALVAHRGASLTHPENTLPAFTASRLAADYVEFDVRIAADGEFYVIHDDRVDRTTNGSGFIFSLIGDQIAGLDAGIKFDPKFAGTRIPTAAEALTEIQAESAAMMEFKSGSVDQAVALLQRVVWRPDSVVLSFNLDWLARLKTNRPDIRVGWLGGGELTNAMIDSAARQGVHLLGWRHSDLQVTTVEAAQARGMVLYAWTVNESKTWDQLARLGVDGIVTDAVEEADRSHLFAGPVVEISTHTAATEDLSASAGGRVILDSGAVAKVRRKVIWRREADNKIMGQSGSFMVPAGGPHARETYRAEWVGRDGLTRTRSFRLADADRDGGLINISARVSVGIGDRTPVVGWVTTGAHPTPFLVRGVGPSLRSFGVPDAVDFLNLTVFSDGLLTAGEMPNPAETVTTDALTARLGAFPLQSAAGDFAQVATLTAGAHTAHLSGPAGSAGTGLLEVYRDNANATAEPARLMNLSFRGWVPRQGNLVAGFVIDGPGSRLVLIRGVGPGLRRYGIREALADPWLRLVNGRGSVVAASDDWSSDDDSRLVRQALPLTGSPELLAEGGRDAALLLNLRPGIYTTILESVDTSVAGVALLELFHLEGLAD